MNYLTDSFDLATDQRQQLRSHLPADFCRAVIDCGERGIERESKVGVVASDDRDIIWNSQAPARAGSSLLQRPCSHWRKRLRRG